jgi:hypothetical protein
MVSDIKKYIILSKQKTDIDNLDYALKRVFQFLRSLDNVSQTKTTLLYITTLYNKRLKITLMKANTVTS